MLKPTRRRLVQTVILIALVLLEGPARLFGHRLGKQESRTTTDQGAESPSDDQRNQGQSRIDGIYRIANPDALPTPDTTPAVAITDGGLFEYSSDGEGWKPIPQGSEASPIPGGRFDTLKTNSAEVGDSQNTNLDTPLKVRTSDDNVCLGLQIQNDEAAADDPGYAATQVYYTDSGERLAHVSADSHNHWGVYTKGDPIGSGDSQPLKRFSIEGGAAESRMIFLADADVTLELDPGPESDSRIKFFDGDRTERFMFYFDSEANAARLRDQQSGQIMLDVSDGQIGFHSNQVVGLREVSNPADTDLASQEWAWDATDDRWLYRAADGTTHYFEPDGTL